MNPDTSPGANPDEGPHENAGEPSPSGLPPIRRGPPPIPPELRQTAPKAPPPAERFAKADAGAQSIMRVGSVALGFGYGVIGCALIGWLIDWLAGTFPVWLLIMSGLGVIGGGYRFVKEALALVRTPPKG